MKLSKGETLIEVVMSIFIFFTLLVPITINLQSTYEINRKLDIKISKRKYEYNILEYIKSMDFNDISKLKNRTLNFKDTYSILSYLNIPLEYYENVEEEYIIKVESTNYDYCYEIFLNDLRSIYVSKK